MKRLSLALSLLAMAVAAVHEAAAVAAPAKIDQSSWNGLKKPLRLANGTSLSYVELGNPNGQPLLLLHGYTDTSRSWSLIAPYLAGYRLIIPDQRGHGSADAPRCCYSIHVYADDARQLMDRLGIRKAAVLGHSMGSMVAMTMAAEYPGRVTRIVLIGSTALVPVKRGGWLYDNVARLDGRFDPNSTFLREWHPANQPTPIDPIFAAAANEEMLKVPLHVWKGVMREMESVPAGRHAADVHAPVLILSGGKDPLFTPEHHASLIAAFPAGEARVFADLGHNPIWERPEEISKVINRFLEK